LIEALGHPIHVTVEGAENYVTVDKDYEWAEGVVILISGPKFLMHEIGHIHDVVLKKDQGIGEHGGRSIRLIWNGLRRYTPSSSPCITHPQTPADKPPPDRRELLAPYEQTDTKTTAVMVTVSGARVG